MAQQIAQDLLIESYNYFGWRGSPRSSSPDFNLRLPWLLKHVLMCPVHMFLEPLLFITFCSPSTFICMQLSVLSLNTTLLHIPFTSQLHYFCYFSPFYANPRLQFSPSSSSSLWKHLLSCADLSLKLSNLLCSCPSWTLNQKVSEQFLFHRVSAGGDCKGPQEII